jgi:hypothetical protein
MNSQTDDQLPRPDEPPATGETLPARAEDDRKSVPTPDDLVVKGGDPKAVPPQGLKAAPLLFGAFLVIALAAAGVYLARQQLRKEASAPAQTTAPAAETAPAPMTLQLPENAPAAPVAAPHAAPAPDPSKIFNNANDALKAGAEAIGRATPSVEGSITELPPPPEGRANEGLQDAAKDAAKLFAPKDGDAPTIDLSAPPAETPGETPDRGASADYLTPPVAAAIDNARLAAEVEGLKRSLVDIAALNENLAAERNRSAGQAGEIARLKDELQRLKAEGSPVEDRARDAAALAALAAKALSGAAYREELSAFAAEAPGARLPAALTARANEGLATFDGLLARFPALRDEALARARREAAKGPMEKLGASLANFVNLRAAAPREGPGPVAVLSRAEARMGARDLGGAIAEIETLEGGARAAFAGFLADARALIEAEAAFRTAEEGLGLAPGAERAF